MAIWLAFAIMTGLAVMAVLWPLSRRAEPRALTAGDRSFYEAQIEEIDRDLARSLIGADEARAARAEAARRLIRAAADADEGREQECEASLRRRRAASAVALSTIPLVALTLYGAFGSPGLPAQPLATRLAAVPAKLDMAEAVARIEMHLAQHPDDGRGWEVLAPVYLKAGRFEDAAKAYRNSLKLNGETPTRLADYGEALVNAAGGVIEADAREAFEKAAKLDASWPKARYYLALATYQDGDRAGAIDKLKALVASAPTDATWVPAVRARIARLEEPAATSAPSDLPDEQKAAISGMVEGLAARLQASPGDPDGWLRLIRSYAVLGQRDKAQAALVSGREALAGRDADLARLSSLAAELKLEPSKSRP